MRRATTEQTWAEWMYEKTRKEVVEKLESEAKRREITTSREILGILADRFGPLPAPLIAAAEACEDRDRLRAAIRLAATAASLDAFRL